MDLLLSRECAEQRIWPAIHINKSGTRKEDLLMDKETHSNMIDIRRKISTKDEISAMSEFITMLEG